MSSPLHGCRVLSLESRKAAGLAALVEKQGGEVWSAPLLEELPLGPTDETQQFAAALRAGELDALVLLTGVGFKLLAGILTAEFGEAQLCVLLRGVKLCARGPKPTAVLRSLGLRPDVVAAEPNTWRELVAAIDADGAWIDGAKVVIQEYGAPSHELAAALRERGATVSSVSVYRWGLPADLGPARVAIERLLRLEFDAVLFTSAIQIDHFLEVAGPRRDGVIAALAKTCVGAVGPTTAQALARAGVAVTVVPERPKMGPLVKALAIHRARIL